MPTETSPDPHLPSLDEFLSWPLDDQLFLLGDKGSLLPEAAQKLIIGLATFAGSAQETMVQLVSRLDDNSYQTAKQLLIKLNFISTPIEGRVALDPKIRDIVNGPLQELWGKQSK